MIKINLLGQARPKAAGAGVPLESTIRVGMLLGALAIAGIILGINYVQMGQDLDKTNQEIRTLTVEKTRLQAIKMQVEQFRSQKAILQQRIDVIENLQRSRTGGQDLLAMVANTVVRTDSLWLTSLTRKGNSLAIQGEAGSINAVANFITQLKRSGAFGKVEIKEAK
jgi:Tfp pilus assembly protein PilN